jgi:hypothetical protein
LVSPVALEHQVVTVMPTQVQQLAMMQSHFVIRVVAVVPVVQVLRVQAATAVQRREQHLRVVRGVAAPFLELLRHTPLVVVVPMLVAQTKSVVEPQWNLNHLLDAASVAAESVVQVLTLLEAPHRAALTGALVAVAEVQVQARAQTVARVLSFFRLMPPSRFQAARQQLITCQRPVAL